MVETASTAKIAENKAKEILRFFKWKIYDENLENKDYLCQDVEKHFPDGKYDKHPLDMVFSYIHPYSGKTIFFYSDLKSYTASSISPSKIKETINSLAKSIACARDNNQWRLEFSDPECLGDVRGLLFLLNHDGDYSSDILSRLNVLHKLDPSFKSTGKCLNVENLHIEPYQFVHLMDPTVIVYINTITKDILKLRGENKFPLRKNDYHFFYPDLQLRRLQGDLKKFPCTVETICGPYLIIGYDEFKCNDYETGTEQLKGAGYILYYRLNGSTQEEFLFLIDQLAKFQILKENKPINIRQIHLEPHNDAEYNFKNAVKEYIKIWGISGLAPIAEGQLSFESVVNLEKRFLLKPLNGDGHL